MKVTFYSYLLGAKEGVVKVVVCVLHVICVHSSFPCQNKADRTLGSHMCEREGLNQAE